MNNAILCSKVGCSLRGQTAVHMYNSDVSAEKSLGDLWGPEVNFSIHNTLRSSFARFIIPVILYRITSTAFLSGVK